MGYITHKSGSKLLRAQERDNIIEHNPKLQIAVENKQHSLHKKPNIQAVARMMSFSQPSPFNPLSFFEPFIYPTLIPQFPQLSILNITKRT